MTPATGYSAENFARTFAMLPQQWPNESADMRLLRQSAFDRLLASGLPNRQNEEWKYTSLRDLADGDFHLITPAEARSAQVELPAFLTPDAVAFVFVDGHYRQDLSRNVKQIPAGMRCQPIRQALSETTADVKKSLFDERTADRPFEAMSAAFTCDGLWIDVPRNIQCDTPLYVLHLQSDRATRMAVFPALFVNLAPLSHVQLIEYFQGEGTAGYLVNARAHFAMGESAIANHVRIVHEGNTSTHIGSTRVAQQRNSRFEQIVYSQSGRLVRHSAIAELMGEGSETRLQGLYLGEKSQHVDHYTSIDHLVPHTTSHQLYKGILTDQSRGVFMGRVKVHQDAQQTVALQQNKNLLLSTEAEVDTKPQLEIDADDVKCSHGATIGQMAEDEIFYLMSRGIPRQRVQHLLCEGFAQDAFSNCADTTGRKLVAGMVRDFFARGHFGV